MMIFRAFRRDPTPEMANVKTDAAKTGYEQEAVG
jgi:hypothetical protein